ncbi:MAG: hypothetical protein PHX03_01725 [Bacilli bacterium]|nr:hypothetical protein [Bacilli bacterium]
MKQEDLDIVINEWNETDPESKFILVYENKGYNISYARNNYISLLEPYDLYDEDFEEFTLEQVLEHEVPEGIEGYIYEKDINGNIKLLAKIEKIKN